MIKPNGVTPSQSPTDPQYAACRAFGIDTLRMVGTSASTTIDATGHVAQWSGALEGWLRKAKQFGYVVHLVVGEFAPIGLLPFGPPAAYPTTWPVDFPETQYRAFIRATLDHLHIDNSLASFILEVGNEPDGGQWYDKVNPVGGKEQLSSYWHLYRIIQDEVSKYLVVNPGCSILLGGPASAGPSWMTQFVNATKGMKRDFASFHFYGRGARLDDVIQAAQQVKSIDPKCLVFATETGADPYAGANHIAINNSQYGYDWMRMLMHSADVWGFDRLYLLQICSADGMGIWNADGAMSTHGRALLAALN